MIGVGSAVFIIYVTIVVVVVVFSVIIYLSTAVVDKIYEKHDDCQFCNEKDINK